VGAESRRGGGVGWRHQGYLIAGNSHLEACAPISLRKAGEHLAQALRACGRGCFNPDVAPTLGTSATVVTRFPDSFDPAVRHEPCCLPFLLAPVTPAVGLSLKLQSPQRTSGSGQNPGSRLATALVAGESRRPTDATSETPGFHDGRLNQENVPRRCHGFSRTGRSARLSPSRNATSRSAIGPSKLPSC
jgi:hypothetical protein